MTNIKTAISIREPLFQQIEAIASDLNISRSRVFVLAVEEFLKRYNNQQLLKEINDAYDDLPDESEELYRVKRRQQQRNLLEGEW